MSVALPIVVIMRGQSGPKVKAWQEFLIKQGFSVGAGGADGIFGNSTDSATRQWQKANGLVGTGIVDPQAFAVAIPAGFSFSNKKA